MDYILELENKVMTMVIPSEYPNYLLWKVVIACAYHMIDRYGFKETMEIERNRGKAEMAFKLLVSMSKDKVDSIEAKRMLDFHLGSSCGNANWIMYSIFKHLAYDNLADRDKLVSFVKDIVMRTSHYMNKTNNCACFLEDVWDLYNVDRVIEDSFGLGVISAQG